MNKRFLGVIGTLALSVMSLGFSAADVQPPAEAKQTSGSDALSSVDKRFILDAASGGQAEVELGQLARDTAQSDAVKKYGQRMIDDHSLGNIALTGLAAQKGMTIPEGLNAKDQSLKDRLGRLYGEAFDKEYMREMVKAHEQDVAAFQREAAQGKDADLTNWVRSALPTLQTHLVMARDVESLVNKGKQLVVQ